VLRGRFDIVFRDPSTKQLVFPELKGDKLEALTKGQKVYVPMFESQAGGQVRIVSSKGGKLYLPKNAVEPVHGRNFLRVGSKNLTEFTGVQGPGGVREVPEGEGHPDPEAAGAAQAPGAGGRQAAQAAQGA